MSRADEQEDHSKETENAGLLPTGKEAKELIEVLAALYRAVHNPEGAEDDDRNEST